MMMNSIESEKQSLYPDGDRYQNLISCSSAHCQPSLKISCKSVETFLHKVANKQTNRQTNNDENISSLAEVTTFYNRGSGSTSVARANGHLNL